MARYEIRLGAKITLDSEQEADLIKVAERLNQTRRMSEFMTALFRTACDSISLLKSGKQEDVDTVAAGLSAAGLNKERKEFFDSLTRKVTQMHDKIDEVYNIALKTDTLAKLNKMNGLEGKSQNAAMAQFALQKQMKDLENACGVMFGPYESGMALDMSKKADDILEYIIETYDGIGDALGVGKSNAADSMELEEAKRNVKELEEANRELRNKMERQQNEQKLGAEAKLEELNNSSRMIEELTEKVKSLEKQLTNSKLRLEEAEDENSLLRRKVKRLSEDSEVTTEINKDEDIEIDIDNNEKEEQPVGNFDETADFGALSNFFGA